jgi:excisionase family DNA binding protein
MIDLEDLISQAEAARLRGVSRQAIAQMVVTGRLTVYQVGGRPLLSKKEVLQYKDGRTAAGRLQAEKRHK